MTDDRRDVQIAALEAAFRTPVRALEGSGTLAAGGVAGALAQTGNDLIVASHLEFTRSVGREMIEIGKRLG